jgi:hypothetical protein
MPEARPPEKVWEDRANAAWERANTLTEDMGQEDEDIIFYISGGGEFDGDTEAEHVHTYLEESGHPLVEEYDVNLTEESTDTETNVDEIYRIARQEDVDTIHPVSSKDHISRVHRDYLFHEESNGFSEYELMTKGSESTYTESGKPPFIGEMGEYAPIFGAVDSAAWSVPMDRREDAGEEVERVLQSFQN